MRNLLLWFATAALVFGGLAATGFAAAPLLLPEPPNIYRTSVYDITMPKGWICEIEVTESVCRPAGPPPYRATMIASMKYRDPRMDTLDAYQARLEKPFINASHDGKPMISTVEHIGRTTIEDRIWVDGTHLNSELRGYRTRYLGTVTVQVGILLTFSAYEKDFQTYQPMFERTVRSLNIYQRYDAAAESTPG
jgi:hypothetical protein